MSKVGEAIGMGIGLGLIIVGATAIVVWDAKHGGNISFHYNDSDDNPDYYYVYHDTDYSDAVKAITKSSMVSYDKSTAISYVKAGETTEKYEAVISVCKSNLMSYDKLSAIKSIFIEKKKPEPKNEDKVEIHLVTPEPKSEKSPEVKKEEKSKAKVSTVKKEETKAPQHTYDDVIKLLAATPNDILSKEGKAKIIGELKVNGTTYYYNRAYHTIKSDVLKEARKIVIIKTIPDEPPVVKSEVGVSAVKEGK